MIQPLLGRHTELLSPHRLKARSQVAGEEDRRHRTGNSRSSRRRTGCRGPRGGARNDGPRDGRFPGAGGTGEKAVLGALAVFDRREGVGHLVHVAVPADKRIREVVIFEDRSVAYHITEDSRRST